MAVKPVTKDQRRRSNLYSVEIFVAGVIAVIGTPLIFFHVVSAEVWAIIVPPVLAVWSLFCGLLSKLNTGETIPAVTIGTDGTIQNTTSPFVDLDSITLPDTPASTTTDQTTQADTTASSDVTTTATDTSTSTATTASGDPSAAQASTASADPTTTLPTGPLPAATQAA
jgi:hypothetical protein